MAAQEEQARRGDPAGRAGEGPEGQNGTPEPQTMAQGSSALKALLVPEALVRIGIGLIVLGGMTTGAFFVVTDVIGPRLGPIPVEGVPGTAIDGDVAPTAELPGDQYAIEDIVLNPAGSRGKRFLRLGIALETKGGLPVVDELGTRSYQVRDLLIRKFSSRTIDELADPIVREEIRLSCIEEINAMLVAGKIS
ncbi:unnamed protein product, partial [marine sediment metagenome]